MSTIANIVNDIRNIHPDALHVVRSVLEERAGSALNKTDNLELRTDMRRVYALMSRLLDEVRNELTSDDITKVCCKNKIRKDPNDKIEVQSGDSR